MQENLRGEMTPAKTENVENESTSFINALIKMIDNKEKNVEENQYFALNLIPKVINELIESNNISMLRKLRNYISNINFFDATKKNPLHIAAIKGNIKMIKFLLKLRIGINDMDDKKRTPLNYACLCHHPEAAKLIKEKGGIVNNTEELSSILCDLAVKGDLDSIRIYHESGANLALEDYDKRTLAHIAASEGHVNIIKFLLEEANINLMTSDRWGNTPYSEATSEEIRNLIKKKYRYCNLIIFFFFIKKINYLIVDSIIHKKRKREEYKFTLMEDHI